MFGSYIQFLEVLTILIGVVSLGLVGFLSFKKQFKIYQVYPVVAVALGILYIFAIPTFSTPDEPYHFDGAYNVSNMILGVKTPEEKEVAYHRVGDVDYEALYGDEKFYFNQGLYERYGQEFSKKTDDKLVKVKDQARGDHNVIAYIISAIGITLGRLLHLNFAYMAILGTIFNLAWFILWMTYALKKIPLGERALMVVLLLPMTLQQASSFSRDNGVIIASVLVITLALKWRHTREKALLSEKIIFAISGLVLLTVKSGLYAYLVLFALMIFWNRKWFAGKKKIILIAAGVTGIVAVIVFLLPLHGWDRLQPILQAEMYQKDTNTYGHSIYYYMTHIPALIGILWNTAKEMGAYYLVQLTGHGLGWLEIPNHKIMKLAYLVVTVLSTVRLQREKICVNKQTRVWGILFVMAGLLMCAVPMLLACTPQGGTVIEGLQGRYFLPFLLLVFVGLGFWKKPVLKIDLNKYYPMALLVLGLASVMTVIGYSV